MDLLVLHSELPILSLAVMCAALIAQVRISGHGSSAPFAEMFATVQICCDAFTSNRVLTSKFHPLYIYL